MKTSLLGQNDKKESFREKFTGFLLHICVICSCVCMIGKVLDWYNPYMDFSGHVFWAQNMLCISVVLLSLDRSFKEHYDKKDNSVTLQKGDELAGTRRRTGCIWK